MNELKRGKPHEIAPSPCPGCEKYKSSCMCEAWIDWLEHVWPVVTGRKQNHEPR